MISQSTDEPPQAHAESTGVPTHLTVPTVDAAHLAADPRSIPGSVSPGLDGSAAQADPPGGPSSADAPGGPQRSPGMRPALSPPASPASTAAEPPDWPPGWPGRLSALAVPFYGWLSQPRVRLAVTGVILLVIGGLIATSSVWTLPLVVVGGVMVVIAWIGRRLDGRFAVEWGETGTQLEFRAKIKAAHHRSPAVSAASPIAAPAPLRAPEPEAGQVIDGEAHTVEIEVGELKALIAAAEASSGEYADGLGQATRNLRVAHRGTGPSEAVG